jgi:hypothetical protein
MWFDYVDIHVEGSKQHLQSDSNRNLKQKNKLQIVPDIRKPWNNPCCEAHLVFERDHNFKQNGGGASEQIKIQRDDVVPQELMLICLFYTLCWLNDPLYISFFWLLWSPPSTQSRVAAFPTKIFNSSRRHIAN